MEKFGEQLSAARKAKKYTQEQLAEKLSISRTNISRWESGKMMPDLDTIKQLSRILEYNFFAVDLGTPAEALPESPAPAAEPTASPSADDCIKLGGKSSTSFTPPKKKKFYILSIFALCVVCLTLLLRVLPKPAAVITVAPLSPVNYLETSDDFSGGKGWHVTFAFTNTSNIPFTPNRVVAIFYENERIDNKITLNYDALRPWMDSDKLLAQDTPLQLLFASEHLYLTHMDCVIYGTDDNGHDLQFKGHAALSQSDHP